MRDYLKYRNVIPFIFFNQILGIFHDKSFFNFPFLLSLTLLSLFVEKIVFVKIFTTPTNCKPCLMKSRKSFENIDIVKLIAPKCRIIKDLGLYFICPLD